MPGRVLITGFEPFGGSEVNPSGQAALELDGQKVAGKAIVGRVLPVVYELAVTRLLHYVREHEPELVLLSGQGNRPELAVERVALNLSGPGRDNAGNAPRDEPVVAGGPAAYFTTLPVGAILRALRLAGIPARQSYSAGTYLCNHVFYGCMHGMQGRPARAGFIHVPPLPGQAAERGGPSMAQELTTRALLVAARAVLEVPGPAVEGWRGRAALFLLDLEEGWRQGRCRWWELLEQYRDLFFTSGLEAELAAASDDDYRGRVQDLLRLARAGAQGLALAAYRAWLEDDAPGPELLLRLPPDFFTLQTHLAGTDAKTLARQASWYLETTRVDYRRLLDQAPARWWQGSPQLESALGAGRLLRALEETLDRLGLSEAAVEVEPRAGTPAAGQAGGGWLNLAPGPGIDCYRANFRAAGKALHIGYMRPGLPFERRWLGDEAQLEASGELLSGLITEPVWLERVMGLRCTPDLLCDLRRQRLLRVHRRAALVAGWIQTGQAVDADPESREQTCRMLVEEVSEVTGAPYTVAECVRALAHWKWAVTELRGLLLENRIRENLQDLYGPAWMVRSETGAWLRQRWALGLTPRQGLGALEDY